MRNSSFDSFAVQETWLFEQTTGHPHGNAVYHAILHIGRVRFAIIIQVAFNADRATCFAFLRMSILGVRRCRHTFQLIKMPVQQYYPYLDEMQATAASDLSPVRVLLLAKRTGGA